MHVYEHVYVFMGFQRCALLVSKNKTNKKRVCMYVRYVCMYVHEYVYAFYGLASRVFFLKFLK
jgi:hypothetical protein